MISSSPRQALAPMAKKKPGAGKKVQCEKGLRGGTQKAPSPYRKALDAMRPWVPGFTGNKRCRQNPKKGASIAPALEALPLALTRARGWGDPLYPLRCDHLLGFSRQSVAAKQKGKQKNKTRKTHEDPCRLASQEKASEGPRRIPKTPGAQNGTPEKRQEAGRTAKTGGTDKSGGTQKRKRTRKTGACAGVSCYYLNFVS